MEKTDDTLYDFCSRPTGGGSVIILKKVTLTHGRVSVGGIHNLVR